MKRDLYARAELDGTEVAVKRLRSDRVTEKDLKAFQEEASIMRKITAHPNIGIVFDVYIWVNVVCSYVSRCYFRSTLYCDRFL